MQQANTSAYPSNHSLAESLMDSQRDDFSFRDLIAKVFLRPKTFLLALILPAIVATFLTSLVPATWTASTKILIRYSNTDSGLLKDIVADSRSNLSGTTSAELIKSLPVLENTIRTVGITDEDIYQKPLNVIKSKISGFLKPVFGDDETGKDGDGDGDELQPLVNAFRESLNSSSKKSSSKKSIEILEKNSQSGDYSKIDELIALHVKSYNREKVAEMANGLAQAFIDDFYRMYAEEASKQSSLLQDLVARQVDDLRAAEKATPADFAAGRLSANGLEFNSKNVPIIMTMATQLNAVENELTKTSQIYASDSLQVKRLRAQVSKLKFLLKKQELIEMNKQLLDQLKARLYQAQNTENIYKDRLIPISIVEKATTPPAKGGSNLAKLIVTAIIGLILGLMLAIALMVIFNVLDPRLHFRREVEALTHLPVLSALPIIKPEVGEFKLKHFRLLKNDPVIKDGFFQVIAKIGQRTNPDDGKVITISAVSAGDGATFSALALALNLSKNKSTKVCLIDANFAHPMLSTLFGASDDFGLIDALIASQPLTKYQHNISFNFSVIGTGSTGNKNQLGFYTDAANEHVNALRKLFDYIIIDTGTILKGNETAVFAGLADESVVVAASGITRKGLLKAAIAKMQSNQNKVSGIIFNQTRQIIPDFIYRLF